MVRRLRAGLLAVVVAMTTCVGVLAASAPASAVVMDVDPRSAYSQSVDVPSSPQEAWNNIIAYLSGQRSCQDALCGPGAAQQGAPFPVIESMLTKVGGTPAQVAAGEKMASKACRTGYGCIGVLAAMLGLGAVGTSDVWGPWVQQFGVEAVPEPQLYTKGYGDVGYYCNMGAITGFTSWSPTSVSVHCTASFSAGAVNVGTRIAYDLLEKTTGVWYHSADNLSAFGLDGGQTVTKTFNILNGRDPLLWEVRRVHFVSDATFPASYPGVYGWDKGFYWGQELPPATGNIESLTRCQRPDNSTYDVVTVEPVASGLAGVPACNAGDTPVYTQTTLIDPDGTRHVQSSQRLNTADDANEQFPLCVAGGCKWLVKVDGVPCARGSAACVEWARDKASATCWYGPYQMPIGLCYPLERSYENQPQELPITKENTDGDPDSHDGPEPELEPTSSPTPSSSTTVTTSPTTTTSPSVSPSSTSSVTSSTDPSPSPSGSSSASPTAPPGTGPGTAGAPDPADAAASRCWPAGWGWFNPAEWVLKPIGCAFIPSPEKVAAVRTAVGTDVAQSGVGDLVAAVGAPIDAMSSGSGCSGIEFDLPINGQSFHGSILNACSGSMATAAHISSVLIGLSVVLSGGMALLRLAGAGFGYNVKVGDGGGD